MLLSSVASRALRRRYHASAHQLRLLVGGSTGSSMLELIQGDLALNTQGSVVLKEDKLTLLATICSTPSIQHRLKTFQVDYRERQIAFGKHIPKKERETDRETAISCGVERTLGSMLPTPLPRDMQVVVNVLSSEGYVDADVNVYNAASAVMAISPFPWLGPVAAVRVAKIKDSLVVNPTNEQRNAASAELLYVGTKDKAVSLEFFGREVSPVVLLEALQLAKKSIQPVLQFQEDLVNKSGASKAISSTVPQVSPELLQSIRNLSEEAFREVLLDPLLSLPNRESALLHLQTLTRSHLKDSYPSDFEVIEGIVSFKNQMIRSLLKENARSDGRKIGEARTETVKPKYLPPIASGSALFQRGNFQISSTVTVGARLADFPPEKTIVHTYDALPFSRNTTGKNFATRSNIEIGMMVENALKTVIPDPEKFSFLTRLATDVLTADGEPLSAAITSGSAAITTAGVPVYGQMGSACYGILVDGPNNLLISDPTMAELNVLDGDVVVSGTRKGLTHLHVKAKRGGLSHQTVLEAVDLALIASQKTLDVTESEVNKVKKQISIMSQDKIEIPADSRGKLIGFNGSVIRAIEQASGTNVNVSDTGFATIFGPRKGSVDLAKKLVHNVVNGFLTDSEFEVRVTKVAEYGVYAEITVFPLQTVFIHQSELPSSKPNKPVEFPKIDNVIKVKGLGYERMGKPAFSRKRLLEAPESHDKDEETKSRPGKDSDTKKEKK